MSELEILSGNACFLVRNTSEALTRDEFEDYLKGEGFKKFGKYMWKDRGSFYINVNSMRYSAGVPKPVKLAQTMADETPRSSLTITEFRTIWDILKNRRGDLESFDEITWGTSAFLIRDEVLEKSDNEFTEYLEAENFKRLADDGYARRCLAVVNVKTMVYSAGETARRLASLFAGDSSACALSADEFKTIWSIIRKYKKDCGVEELLRQCAQTDDYLKAIECSDRVLDRDPDNHRALYYKIRALFMIRQYAEALDLIDYAAAIYPTDYRFSNFRAFMLTDLYRLDEAVESYNRSFILGGFDAEDNETLYEYRAKCYLKKAREEFYIKKDLDGALKSLNVYLNRFPDDEDALRFGDEMSHGKITPLHTRYHEKLMYFEKRAYELYELGFLKESLQAYQEVLEASEDFKNNKDETGYRWFDSLTGHGTSEVDNFRWYSEVLSACLTGFKGDYDEFFTRLFEVNEDNISACLDKAWLLSKIYRSESAIKYSKMLLKHCPENEEVREFYNKITWQKEKNRRLDECDSFKDYANIDEYVSDVKFSLMHFCRFSEAEAEKFIRVKMDEIRGSYEDKCPANDLTINYYPLCG